MNDNESQPLPWLVVDDNTLVPSEHDHDRMRAVILATLFLLIVLGWAAWQACFTFTVVTIGGWIIAAIRDRR